MGKGCEQAITIKEEIQMATKRKGTCFVTLGIPVELTQGEKSRGLRINGKICGELVGQMDEEGDHTQDQNSCVDQDQLYS